MHNAVERVARVVIFFRAVCYLFAVWLIYFTANYFRFLLVVRFWYYKNLWDENALKFLIYRRNKKKLFRYLSEKNQKKITLKLVVLILLMDFSTWE